MNRQHSIYSIGKNAPKRAMALQCLILYVCLLCRTARIALFKEKKHSKLAECRVFENEEGERVTLGALSFRFNLITNLSIGVSINGARISLSRKEKRRTRK